MPTAPPNLKEIVRVTLRGRAQARGYTFTEEDVVRIVASVPAGGPITPASIIDALEEALRQFEAAKGVDVLQPSKPGAHTQPRRPGSKTHEEWLQTRATENTVSECRG